MSPAALVLAGALLLAAPAMAQSDPYEDTYKLDDSVAACHRYGPEQPLLGLNVAAPPLLERYAEMAKHHRLSGEACYYSASFDGRKTASGEVYRNSRLSAAHRTLPLGCRVEVRSRATGKVIRLKVNDRGPYSGRCVLDLSRAAAHALGVDTAEDRRVDIRVIALPGDER